MYVFCKKIQVLINETASHHVLTEKNENNILTREHGKLVLICHW